MPQRPHIARSKVKAEPKRLKAAQYVRASTSHQKYSIENQSLVISEYARAKEIKIVRTYSDPARSGLFFRRRTGLQRLITDVQAGQADFNVILVYDVSRWGRFQDTDESAYYEFICKRAGVTVRYCSELFENTGGLFDNLLKHMKRTMAAEYSRDLSRRISLGHERMAGLGLHQGGPAKYGLRRIIVDEHGQPKGQLEFGQHKSFSTDRVILAPGPAHEIEVIREIFRLFVDDRLSQRHIARVLNERGVLTSTGHQWSGETVYRVLTCEKYIGTFVYRQSTYNLGSERTWQPSEKWIRVPGVIQPIVDADVFNSARYLIWNIARFDRNHMLDCLTAALCSKGYLSAKTIDRMPCMPSLHAYFTQFGSLTNAYRLIGYKNRRRYHYNPVTPVLRRLDSEIAIQVATVVESCGGRIDFDDKAQTLIVDGGFVMTLRLAPHVRWKTFAGWRLSLGRMPPWEAVLVGRLNEANAAVQDFYVFPRDYFKHPTFHITPHTEPRLRSLKLAGLSEFYQHYRRNFADAEN
jgi:DNA invertase Pin-like site-specific DNA recombinase